MNSTEKEQKVIADQLRRAQSGTPLLEARYIRAGLKQDFQKTVAKALYADITPDPYGTSPLLKALIRLSMPRRNRPGLRSTITYNFDDLLERHLVDADVPHRAIYRDGDFASPDELGIFHVHGFLPRDAPEDFALADNLLIFSEERYHSLMLEPYSWSNLVQLAAFREETCLFVGLSMSDPNMRRLLEVASKSNQSPRHYVILRRLTPHDLDTTEDNLVRTPVVQAFVSAHHRLQETSLKELGLNVLWVDDHAEIPPLIDTLSQRAGLRPQI